MTRRHTRSQEKDRLWYLSQTERAAGKSVHPSRRAELDDALAAPTPDEESRARYLAELGTSITRIARTEYPAWLSIADVMKALDAISVSYGDRIDVEQAVWRQVWPDRYHIPPVPSAARLTYSLNKGLRWIDPNGDSNGQAH